MSAFQHYRRAPVTEAVIDLRVTLPSEVTLPLIEYAFQSERPTYPQWRDYITVAGQLSVGAGVAAAASRTPMGRVLVSSDGRQVCQARLDGFTFSRLAPYEHWGPFRTEARRLWDIYRDAVHPIAVTRIAVRYINRLDLPLPMQDLGDYLRTAPEVSPDLPQALSGYLLRLQIPDEESRATLLLNQTTVQPSKEGVVSIVLDIDLFRELDSNLSDDEIWRYFEQLRLRKNQIFEACITDRTRELIR